MKNLSLLLAVSISVVMFASCKKDNKENKPPVGDTKEAYIDASSAATWHYFSFANNKIEGSAEESEENDAIWKGNRNWDIAVKRYHIRTNSGEFTTTGASGGVYTFDENTTFESVLKVPANASFAIDKMKEISGMGGVTRIILSDAQVIKFKVNEDGSLVMPPVYLPTPVYIFRSADGTKYYKLLFTQYKNEEGKTGHVKFKFSEINK